MYCRLAAVNFEGCYTSTLKVPHPGGESSCGMITYQMLGGVYGDTPLKLTHPLDFRNNCRSRTFQRELREPQEFNACVPYGVESAQLWDAQCQSRYTGV